jgi:hypothetical protein
MVLPVSVGAPSEKVYRTHMSLERIEQSEEVCVYPIIILFLLSQQSSVMLPIYALSLQTSSRTRFFQVTMLEVVEVK